MAQVPLRMAQPGLVPPHQQRPPMMVSMTQPPPVSMQGLVSMAPMMGPGGGMALMTQAMNHPESGHEHHTMNGPFHHHHHHHHHHAHHPPHGAAPRPHGPSQGHPVPPPPHPSGPPQPPHSAPPHSQYHPHPAAPHHVPHSHHNGPHSVHHSSPHSASHSHSGPPPPPHMTSHTNSSNSNTHSTHGHPQSHLQSGPPHMNQPGHSIPHHSPHQMSGMSTGTLSSNQHHTQQQHHHSQHPHHQPMHQQMQHSQLPQQPPPPQPPQQHLQHQVLSQPPQHQVPHSAENPKLAGGMIVLSNNTEPSCTTMNMVNTLNATPSSGTGANAVVNGIVNRNSSTVNLNTVETTITSSSCSSSLVSTREKTPMCLINELARYNKISHQYCLTDEKGPAHKKIFTVTLKLGDSEEEYSASGPSIKKAQHSAAALSLEKTKFKHPPPKTPKQNKQTKLTPTVELNALAMKRGEAAVYTFIEPPRPPNPYAYNVPPNLRGVYSQKFYGRPPVYPMFFVSLRVGNRDFGGEGATAQQAKHNAASKALKVIKSLPMPETSASVVQGAPVPGTITVPVSNPVVAVGGGGGVIAAAAASGGGGGSGGGTTVVAPGPDLVQLDPNSDLKSPISLVHEIALKRSLTVSFEVVRESGPPHMRTFVTTCTVGELRTQGEGTGKKVSKKRAAELMLEELKKLPPISTAALTRVKRKPSAKKKSRNLIKVGREEQKAAPEYGQGINPISRLIQIQQAKKEKEPVYTLLAERGVPRRREFVMQVAVGPTTAQGSGPNKKLAKRAAAESMLQLLGYSRPQPQPAKPAIKMDGSHSDPDKTRKQVTFLEENDGSRVSVNDSSQASAIQLQSIPPGSGRQLVPGLIMMQDGSALHGYQQMQASNMSAVVNMNQMVNMQATAAIAKELLESGSSPTAKALSKGQTNGSQPTSKPHLGNHQMGTGVQPPLVHQQPAVVPPPQQPMQPHMNHQPMMQTAPSPQIQGNPQSSQTQQNNSHAQIQSAANVAMTVPTNDNDGTNTSNNANLASNNNSTNNNINSTMTTNKLRGGALTISGNTSGQAFRPKDQLMYLANILNLQVQFTDFPKGSKNKSEFLSLVSLSTSPPHVSHGAGPTTEASHDQACLTALKALAEMGLDTVTSGNASKAT